MKIYKTGDLCPCCDQPIQLTDPKALLAFSYLVELMGLDVRYTLERRSCREDSERGN